MSQLFGWIPPEDRNQAQNEADEKAAASMPTDFAMEGTYHEVKGRFPLWKAMQIVLKKPGEQILPYNWQVTGSCVGAGGGNMAKTLMAMEITQGDLEEYRELWWPFTYGRSRFRAGMTRPGEGSLGRTYAAAAVEDGYLAQNEKPGLPAFAENGGWLQLSESTEYQWSDGDSSMVLECAPIAKLHLVKSAAPIRNSDEGKASLANGYPLTCASNYGTKTIRPQGTPAVNIAEWNHRWQHQMFIDEAWDHPTLGLIFRIGNNWGKNMSMNNYPAPTQGEPWGGFYVPAKDFDGICAQKEVFAFSGLNGFKVRTIDFYV